MWIKKLLCLFIFMMSTQSIMSMDCQGRPKSRKALMTQAIGRHYSEKRKKAKRKQPQKQRDEKKTKKRKVGQPLPSQDAVHFQVGLQPMNDEGGAEEQEVRGRVIEIRENGDEIYKDDGCLNIIIKKREAEEKKQKIADMKRAAAEVWLVDLMGEKFQESLSI